MSRLKSPICNGVIIASPVLGRRAAFQAIGGQSLRKSVFFLGWGEKNAWIGFHRPVRHFFAIGQNPMGSACKAVCLIGDRLSSRYKLASANAYMLTSVRGDLRISETVDAPSGVVSFYFPHGVFE